MMSAPVMADAADDVTADEELMTDEEGHIDFLETQLELAKKVGSENYLQTQIGEGDES